MGPKRKTSKRQDLVSEGENDSQNQMLGKILKPTVLSIDQDSDEAPKTWRHWKVTFLNFLKNSSIPKKDELNVLINYVSPNIFESICNCISFEEAITTLEESFIKPQNVVHARYCLSKAKQTHGESIDQFYNKLKRLSLPCNFQAVTADDNKSEYIRDAFISGLESSKIRQHLFEMKSLTLQDAISQARMLENAENIAKEYETSSEYVNTVLANENKNTEKTTLVRNSYQKKIQCRFCGYNNHTDNSQCPAKGQPCLTCNRIGHFSKVCRARNDKKNQMVSATVISAANTSTDLSKCLVPIRVNGIDTLALLDTGSTASFIDKKLVVQSKMKTMPYSNLITFASSACNTKTTECALSEIYFQNEEYNDFPLIVLNKCCASVILGHDFLKNFSSITFDFGGSKAALQLNEDNDARRPTYEIKKCALAQATVEPVSLFRDLQPDCRPIITKSRRHSEEDYLFMMNEVKRLKDADIIENSHSSWRAQAFVTSRENQKKRMVIDYSQTINKFTNLDAYPLPLMEELVNKVAQYKIFSSIDLKSAYHQIPILPEERHFTAFEVGHKLYQFKRIPFGVTNGVAAFQKVIDQIIEQENLTSCYAYLDDIIVCGRTQEEHDENLENFWRATEKYGLTINEEKCKISMENLTFLGFEIGQGMIKPDPDRLKPLLDLPAPKNQKELKRVLGMLAHYSKWIKEFSKKIHPLVHNTHFPLNEECRNIFESLKKEIGSAVLVHIDEKVPFTLETDASDYAIGAVLTQNERPVAFFSRTLSTSETRHSAVEKEAYAIVESIRKWRHYLLGREFTLITDQKSVSFMFSNKQTSKIKNDKIQRWRLELSEYKFNIIYRVGKENIPADTLSRVCATVGCHTDIKKLIKIHEDLCHPGVTRLHHWTKTKNLPYSIDDVKEVCSKCITCSEMKPRYAKGTGRLIKATRPFERLNMDFKGPLQSSSRNKYILVLIDEYSRFPFAFPCPDMTTNTVIKHLTSLFSLFGVPSYIHSDRGTSFMSSALKNFLLSKGIASSRTSPYNPAGNGQVERYNGVIWKSVMLALKSRGLNNSHWEQVLPDALNSIRSLLCTSTNCTPHERMFLHARNSSNGKPLPTWLLTPGPVWLKKMTKNSKQESQVEKVELIESNPEYAFVRHNDGRESTVSLRQLAPYPTSAD